MGEPFKLTLRVAWWMQIVQMLFALPCTVGFAYTLFLIFQHSSVSIILCLVLLFLAYIGWVNALSNIRITDESVTVTVVTGRYRIRWEEVTRIVLNHPLVALAGKDKWLVISLVFAGRNKKELLAYLDQQISKRKIIFEQDVPDFPLNHKNVRVWF
jgi:hypothetical protein